MFNSGAGGDTIPPSRCLTRYGRVTSKGYPALGTCTSLQYHFYNATCPHRCIHESLLVLYQLGNYYGRYNCSHPWPVGLTRQCAWRRMDCGGVGVAGGFSFTCWLVHFNALAHPFPVFAQCPPTPGSLQLCWVLHPSAASHRSLCYCTTYRSGQR